MVVPYTHESVRLTGRWAKLPGSAVTTAPGAYIECSFAGDMAVLRFDTTRNLPVVPHLWMHDLRSKQICHGRAMKDLRGCAAFA